MTSFTLSIDQRLSSESLREHCLEATELLEQQAGDDSAGGDKGLQISSELERIHKSILQCAGMWVEDKQ